MKKPTNWREAIWGAFDKDDPAEWILLISAYAMLIVFGIVTIL